MGSHMRPRHKRPQYAPWRFANPEDYNKWKYMLADIKCHPAPIATDFIAKLRGWTGEFKPLVLLVYQEDLKHDIQWITSESFGAIPTVVQWDYWLKMARVLHRRVMHRSRVKVAVAELEVANVESGGFALLVKRAVTHSGEILAPGLVYATPTNKPATKELYVGSTELQLVRTQMGLARHANCLVRSLRAHPNKITHKTVSLAELSQTFDFMSQL